MIGREKVIKEFELFIRGFHPACTSEGIELDMLKEVLALLKDQEKEIENLNEIIKKADYTLVIVKDKLNDLLKKTEGR